MKTREVVLCTSLPPAYSCLFCPTPTAVCLYSEAHNSLLHTYHPLQAVLSLSLLCLQVLQEKPISQDCLLPP